MTAPMTCSVCDCAVTRTGKRRAFSCGGCGSVLCEQHTVYYVDGNNRAINDGPPWCEGCYGERFGVRARRVDHD